MAAVCMLVVGACGGSAGKTSDGPKAVSGGDFGTMKQVCHPAKGTNKDPGERGVTKNSVSVVSASDAGSSLRPGLNQELWDASDVFVKWCNDNGGINGRKIILTKGNAELSRYSQVIADGCSNAFALVGGGGVYDNTGQEARVKCLLPDFPAFMGSPSARGSALLFQPMPSSSVQLTAGVIKFISEHYPETRDKVATVYGNVASMTLYRDQIMAAAGTVPGDGMQWGKSIEDIEYQAVGKETWQPDANTLKERGVQGLVFAGEPADLAKLLVAVDATGYTGLKWVYALPNSYGNELVTQAGKVLDSTKVYTHMFALPLETAQADPKAHPATMQYIALFEKYLPTGRSDAMLGLHSFAAWLMFAQAAEQCGTNLTVACLVANASTIEAFDAGGLIAPTDPATGEVPKCFIPIVASSKGWSVPEDFKPKPGPFSCADDNVVDLQGFDISSYGDPPWSLADAGRSLSQLGTPTKDLPGN